MNDKYITVGEAMQRLGVSKMKIAALVQSGELKAVVSKLDKRKKLVKVSDVEKLKLVESSVQ